MVAGLRGFAESVLSVVPAGFEAYARIFHPAYRGEPPVPVLWREIASASGRVATVQCSGHPSPDPFRSPKAPGSQGCGTVNQRKGRGIGTQLMQLLLDCDGLYSVDLVCDEPLLRYYQQFGDGASSGRRPAQRLGAARHASWRGVRIARAGPPPS
jgi:hypothetical protein